MLKGEHQELTGQIIGAAMEVHSTLGPGLLESAYQRALARELSLRGHSVDAQVAVPLVYKGAEVGEAFRIDLLVDGAVVLELKSCEALLPIHKAQLITYLKLSGHRAGLLINFNVERLKHGITRAVS